MEIRQMRLTKTVADVAETIIVSTKISDVTIVRDSKCKDITVCLIAKAKREEYLKVEAEDKKKRFSVAEAESRLIIQNSFCCSSLILSSELLIKVPNDSKVKQVVVKTTSGDIYLDSLYKNLVLTSGSGDIYLNAIFNSEGTKTQKYNELPLSYSKLSCRDCNAQILTRSGDILLELYGTPRDIFYRNELTRTNIRIKNCKKDWSGFRAEILTKSGSLRHEGKICY